MPILFFIKVSAILKTTNKCKTVHEIELAQADTAKIPKSIVSSQPNNTKQKEWNIKKQQVDYCCGLNWEMIQGKRRLDDAYSHVLFDRNTKLSAVVHSLESILWERELALFRKNLFFHVPSGRWAELEQEIGE